MLKTSARWIYRIAAYALLAAWLVFAVAVMVLRYGVLPNIGEYREAIAVSLSKSTQQPISIGDIEAGWHGLRPYLVLRDLTVRDRQGRPALSLQQVESTLSWWSLLVGEIRLHSLEISDPNLAIRRDAAGKFFVGGVEVSQDSDETGFADWVLKQQRIIIRNALISWNDDQRQAPPLILKRFNFRLENSGSHHRFGMRAVPPEQMAGPLDIRGDLKGAGVADLLAWRGALYAALDRTDLAAWRAWFDLPFDLRRGYGEVRLWLNVDRENIADATAEVALSDIDMRWSPELPRLELVTLSGRLGGRFAQPGYELRARRLAFATRDGVAFPPADMLARYAPAAGKKPENGEIRLAGLDLGALASLAAYLPFSVEQRALLAESRPRGTISELNLKWEGDWQAPQHYSAKGNFAGLGVDAFSLKEGGRKLPGFSGMSGTFDAAEKGGTLALNSRAASALFPDLFVDPLAFDTLTAQASWQVRPAEVEFSLTRAAFANPDLAGNAHGSYRYIPGQPGQIDLTGQLTRADARQVSRYLPLVVGRDTRDWLATSIYGGQSQDVRLRLKGNLADFPFADGKRGIFEVAAKVKDGTLEYARGWPRIENIAVDLLFRGARMDIMAHAGTTYGMKIGKVHTAIADLLAGDEILELEGAAHGPTDDMLKFVEESPVSAMIDGFTEGMHAAGNGSFLLKLRIPLRHSKDMQVGGSYQFVNNRVELGNDMPQLEQVNGKLEFTESQVKIPAIAFQALGGATLLDGATQKDGAIRLNLKGRATASGIAKFANHPAADRLGGAAEWRGRIAIRKKNAEFTVDSNLLGLASSLPAPFGKKTGESVPLHLEKKILGPQRDAWLASYGRVFSAQLQRRSDNGRTTVERGVINVGSANAPLPSSGMWLYGEMPYLDLDPWYAVFGQKSENGSSGGLAGINLKCDQFDLHGRRFNNVKVNATSQGENWKATVQSREMAGDISWRPEGQGRVEAHLRHLNVPDSLTEGDTVSSSATDRNWPALDVSVDNLQIKRKKLGRLELKAINEDSDWRIEQLKLSNPDATLTMDGLWQAWRRRPLTRVNLLLDVQDVGKLLVRLGYPNAVKHGKARLEGQLSWQGSPHDIDYPSLSGTMKLEAHNGQFAKIEPGIGKLLGILSLQALPRRITLDFRDVFSEGFAFDDISGTLKASRGVVSSDDFRIDGPAAKVAMKGETDLDLETQNLHVRVVPAIGAGVSMAGALLASPVVGVTALVVQKLLKDPLDQIAAYEYSVRGTWDNPQVEKIVHEVERNESESGF